MWSVDCCNDLTHTGLICSRLQLICNCSWIYLRYSGRGGTVALLIQRWTCDQQVVGSNPTRSNSCIVTFGKLCASVTEQYNLVPAKGRWCSVAGKVTAGLLKSNGSLPPAGWHIVTCGFEPMTCWSQVQSWKLICSTFHFNRLLSLIFLSTL